MVFSEVFCVVGLILMISLTFIYKSMPIVQYLAGLVTLFLGCQVMEGVSTAILSKRMPKHMAKGIFNSGFISTQAGTLGKLSHM